VVPTKRLVCVVEGQGEVKALPNLCSRIRDYLGAWSWFVDPDPVRQPRSRLVNERVPSPRRPAAPDGVERAVRLAMGRPASGILMICDEDDDCAGVWGPSARGMITPIARGDAVMIVREYETWLLLSFSDEDLQAAGISAAETARDAKGLMRR